MHIKIDIEIENENENEITFIINQFSSSYKNSLINKIMLILLKFSYLHDKSLSPISWLLYFVYSFEKSSDQIKAKNLY